MSLDGEVAVQPPARAAVLRVLHPRELRATVPIGATAVVLGRQPGPDTVVIAHATVSRAHARIWWERAGHHAVRDLGRRRGPLVAVNCATLTAHLAESQLFGHVKGAFTGATVDHDGWFRQADGGTLFLDEIGELPLELQPKLLRVVQDGLVQPIGASR